jgi:exopolyphosphatase/guanosine-5'-triphosphate,3'-diphosphate pyrophosphatase
MNEAALRAGMAELLGRFETEPTHTLHVAHLALALFADLQSWHALGTDERLVLEAAATLHDIGWSQTQPDGAGHHKASARLIREHLWPGVPRRWVELIAQVARYHRKSLPRAEHEPYVALDEADRRRVRRLAAILRIADGLDRRHLQTVTSVNLSRQGAIWQCIVAGRDGLEAEIAGARRKADLLEAESGNAVRFTLATDR